MFAKIFDWVSGVVEGVRGRLGLLSAILSVAVVSVLSGSAFAAGETTPITFNPPTFDWQGLSNNLIQTLISPIGVGIGIALSIWVVLRAVSFFKRSST